MSPITAPLTTALPDRHRIENHLREGGVATVYLAHDPKRHRTMALGMLRPERARTLGGGQ